MARNKRPRGNSQAKSRRDSQRALDQKLKAAQRKAEKANREYERSLSKIRGKGIYEPKEKSATKYRKARVRKALSEFGEAIKSGFFLAPNKKHRKRTLERAEALMLETTRTGFFVAKSGHKKAKLKIDRKSGEPRVHMKGATKYGINKGREYETIIPLASIDDVTSEKKRIRDAARDLLPLKKGQFLEFKVVERNREGASHAIFDTPEALVQYLNRYHKGAEKVGQRVHFFRHLVIQRTTETKFKKRRKRQREHGNG